MIKCVPVITATSIRPPARIALDVTLVEMVANIDIHTAYGGGYGFQGKEIGKASVVLQQVLSSINPKEIKVVYLSGYRKDGKDFCVETERNVIEACKNVAKIFWG